MGAPYIYIYIYIYIYDIIRLRVKYFTINSLLHVSEQVAGSDKCCSTSQHFVQYSTVHAGPHHKQNSSLRCHRNNGYVNAPAVFGPADIAFLLSVLLNDAVNCEDYTASEINT